MEVTDFFNSVTLYDFDNIPVIRNIKYLEPLNEKNCSDRYKNQPGEFIHAFSLGLSYSKEVLEKKDIEVQLIVVDENKEHALLPPSISIFCNDQMLALPPAEWCSKMCTFVQRFNDPINITRHLSCDGSEQILKFYSPNGVFQSSGKLFFTVRLVYGNSLLTQKSALFTRPPFSKACFLTLWNRYLTSGDVFVVSERFSLQCPVSKTGEFKLICCVIISL
ncbi:hypothetical protein TPS_00241 [Trichinella pseudospiralis]